MSGETDYPSSETLISVPIDSRPRASELRPYLKNLQAHIVELSTGLADRSAPHANSIGELSELLARLITALSNDIQYLRIPVVWAIKRDLDNKLLGAHERLSDSTVSQLNELSRSTDLLLSHFDLAEHLNEAHARVSKGDDKIDEAFFVELSEDIREFDESRAAVFSNVDLRAQRISAVFRLPSGIVPKTTYLILEATRAVGRTKFLSTLNSVALGAGLSYAVGSEQLSSLAKAVFQFLQKLGAF